MFKLCRFVRPGTTTAVRLPHDLDALLAAWSAVRSRMARNVHPDFARTEWAYLTQFLERGSLLSVFRDTFGEPVPEAGHADLLAAPRTRVALWLPNNVSMLGPLALVLLSLTGCEVRVKAGSHSRDLCTVWIAWLRQIVQDDALRPWLDRLRIESFDRSDPRNAGLAEWADARILFGGDAAADAVERLPHPHSSAGYYFTHKVSEAWTDPGARDPSMPVTLAKVFNVYGQAGCTSPKRVVVVGGTREDARRLATELAGVWPKAAPDLQPRHVASETVMAAQWARAQGFETVALGRNSGVAVLGECGPIPVAAHMAISIQWGSLEQTLATQPANLQTIGHALADPGDGRWLDGLAKSPALRFVPLAEMHHFSPVWDGMAWWQGLFHIRVIRR
jgi:hypothetical protein